MNLTKGQKMILDVEKISGGSINVICGSVIFDKMYGVQEMTEAANKLFEINDALRTKIEYVDGKYFQTISEYKRKTIEVLRFSDKFEVHKYSQELSYVPFDIYGDLCEIKVFVSDGFSGVIYKLHHIISDAWTLSLLASQFYKILNKQEVTAYSYKEHTESEIQYLNSKRFERDKQFYVEQFRNKAEPVYFSDKTVEKQNGKRLSYGFTKEESQNLKSFAEEKGVSLSMLFLTVAGIFYSRVNNNIDKFYIGMPVINRAGTVEKNTVGLFINTAPFLICLQNDKSLLDNMSDVQESVMSTMRHQKYVYEDILSDLDSECGFKGKLYDVLFSYQNAKISGEEFESTWYHSGKQSESLRIHVDDRDNIGCLKIHYDFQIEKFTSEQVDGFHKCICNLLSDAIKNPDKKIIDLDILSFEEKQEIICDFNDTAHKYNVHDNATIYSLFEQNARNNKEKICITASRKSISYGDLLLISERLDKRIRNVTKSKKSIIAVIADRSIEMYTAIYGIIRGGNAYLPISPDYPKDRIDYIFKDSNCALIMVQDKYVNLVGGKECINVSEVINDFSETEETMPCAAEPDDTAYVIYTSGSTGNPKGAKVSHKSAVNRILWMQDKYPLENDSVILQKTPYTFDVSVWEHFWWGMCAGSLVASNPGEHFLPEKILNEVFKENVTHIHFVPSVFDLFLGFVENHEEERFKFKSVKHVILSGEALSSSLIQRFYKLYAFESVKLHNLYGPTECAVDVTYYDCSPDDLDPVPIGKPIYNTSMYVVDKYLNILPKGVIGELCIGGVNVGQGYLNKPQLTAEKFVENPFTQGKLYKTGDLAFFREDGEIVFCGRMDGQVKIGGQRIEIGEIESVISDVIGVESSAVVVKLINGQNSLVAFYCADKDYESEIRKNCESKLPVYMVPAIIRKIENMPLNASGKLDRKTLLKYDISEHFELEIEAPKNNTEVFVCEAFKRALKTDKVGRKTEFFTSGGTSLSMISLLSEKGFSNITAAEFMANSTVEKLSLVISGKAEKEAGFLKLLWKPADAQRAVVLFPFAGGGAEAYSELVKYIKALFSDVSIYFVPYLHSVEECEKAAVEIKNILVDVEVYFYSHCVGAAVAIQILNILEKDSSFFVKHYVAGGFIPMRKAPKKNVWDRVSDKILKSILVKAGAPLDEMSDENVKSIIEKFRKDTDFYTWCFSKGSIESVKSPLTVVVAKNDFFTLNKKQSRKNWSCFAEKLKKTVVLDTDTHYFQSSECKQLSDLIFD